MTEGMSGMPAGGQEAELGKDMDAGAGLPSGGTEAPRVTVLPPITEAERDALRKETHLGRRINPVHAYNLIAGPDGQMISGSEHYYR